MPDFERWLDWELGLFEAGRAMWRRLRPERETRLPAGAARLSELSSRLEPFASVVAGWPVKVVPADGLGGLRGDTLVLPPWMAVSAEPAINVRAYLLRVAVDATTAARRESIPAEPSARLRASAVAAMRSVATLTEALPGFAAAWDALVHAAPPRAELPVWLHAFASRLPLPETPPILHADEVALQHWPLFGRLLHMDGDAARVESPRPEPAPRPTSEHDARAPEDVTVRTLRPEEAKELPVHVFEKVETAEAFSGSMRQLDGADDLDEHLEALQEVDLSTLLRGGPEAHSLLRADVALEADIPDVASVGANEPHVAYDEWDHRQTAYRPAWCQVYPTPVRAEDVAWASNARARLRPVVEQVHRRLLAVRAARASRPRQLDGDELDLDALVATRGDLAAGRTPDPRLFVARTRRARSLAVLALVDVSLSSDAWVDGRRVLDVTRDAVFVLGEVARRLGDRFGVQAFASMTRNQVRVYEVTRPGEPWSVGAARLGALRPVGYTRIGPALRHAAATLGKEAADQRVLVLLSDGRPTDFDRYEGAYGNADVRRALVEARTAGIVVHALTIDHAARGHVASMLGPGSWDLLPDAASLPSALTQLLQRLA